MNYRFKGQQRTLSFGCWPEILLGDAREMLLEARRLLAKGLDPFEQAKLEKIAKSIAATNTFETVTREWREKVENEGLAETGAMAQSALRTSTGGGGRQTILLVGGRIAGLCQWRQRGYRRLFHG